MKLLPLYNLLWKLVLPALKRRARTGDAWEQRCAHYQTEDACDLWLQASSAGESQLSCLLVEQLLTLAGTRPLRLLLTSGTRQGIEILEKQLLDKKLPAHWHLTIRYFPFDAPSIMARAFTLYRPRLIVTIETELWPGLLAEAQRRAIPVMVVNGRLSAGSFRYYRHFPRFFRAFGPALALAVSPGDRDRFASLLGRERTALMSNLKFDRLTGERPPQPDARLLQLLAGQNLVVLGSVRRQEEEMVFQAIQQLRSAFPLLPAIFPKHLDRLDCWQVRLESTGLRVVRRSQLKQPPKPGSVLLWDTFGELAAVYQLATAAFVGGSLVDLGGQNFLEPLACGLRPVIGPHWQDFTWVGQDILSHRLVTEVRTPKELAVALLSRCQAAESRQQVRQLALAYFSGRRGGTAAACKIISQYLNPTT